jgi:hypothetical protein
VRGRRQKQTSALDQIEPWYYALTHHTSSRRKVMTGHLRIAMDLVIGFLAGNGDGGGGTDAELAKRLIVWA